MNKYRSYFRIFQQTPGVQTTRTREQ
ncbi:hypothetical protein OIU77_026856 [Salix suchowensis]|uniref:Uncharacterized protein n=1 Tax=Salix suchowensis TaxID=1278906 RepID=A0ABQ9BMI7_9ROSI|nr:hypothetical protein OIU77_026856 [Salix suchowensis]